MIEQLFSSKILFALLAFMFADADKKYSTAELIKATKKNQANILRELRKFEAVGLIERIKQDNQNYYFFRKDSQFFNQLEALFLEHNRKTGQRFVLINEEGGAALLPLDFFIKGFNSDLVKELGILENRPDLIAEYKSNYLRGYFDATVLAAAEKEGLSKLLDNPEFVWKKIYPLSIEKGEESFRIFEKLKAKKYKVNAKEAVEYLHNFIDIITMQISCNFIAVFDLRDYAYTNYCKKYFAKVAKGSKYSVNKLLEKLLAPEELTLTQKMRLEIMELVENDLPKKTVEVQLLAIRDKWQWLNYGYRGPELGVEFFEEIYNGLKKKDRSELKREKNNLVNYSSAMKAEKKVIFDELKIDDKHKKYLEALAVLSLLKVYRKDISFLLIFLMYKILEQFGGKYSRRDWYYLTLDEAEGMIKGELNISKAELRKREAHCLHFGPTKEVLTGKMAREFIENRIIKDVGVTQQERDGLKLLEGTTACLGKTGNWVHGEVRIVNSTEDLGKIVPGDIMLSVATTPELLSAMKKAAAIVTDNGGLTCHAAIVSRELNVPCLIGTKYATKLFKDGDKVVVCPRHGYIKFQ